MDKMLLQVDGITAPSPIHYSFSTIGWFVVEGVLFVILILLMGLFLRRYYRNRFRREAISFLVQMEKGFFGPKEFNQVNRYLKELIIHKYPELPIDGYYGERWYNFLTHSCKKEALLTLEEFQQIELYRRSGSTVPIDTELQKRYISFMERWILTHRIK
ncbi:DUF4381 domain-containing protein [Halosquirtibacter laminarini]|uniref:DUF4381 domain-containing protein n=1 Tax=Halosquirtibacter laminarini TaxID=3374600 RepID=A0AC61NL63_9BACT|nr:DUF4381 domain-containing protein [Prolixibacteraceae bacterium]